MEGSCSFTINDCDLSAVLRKCVVKSKTQTSYKFKNASVLIGRSTIDNYCLPGSQSELLKRIFKRSGKGSSFGSYTVQGCIPDDSDDADGGLIDVIDRKTVQISNNREFNNFVKTASNATDIDEKKNLNTLWDEHERKPCTTKRKYIVNCESGAFPGKLQKTVSSDKDLVRNNHIDPKNNAEFGLK